MEEINNIDVVPCTESEYLKPFTVHYNQNGTKKSWDFMRTHDRCQMTKEPQVALKPQAADVWSGPEDIVIVPPEYDGKCVSVLIFNTSSHCFVLVKQFRPAVYMCEWERSKSQPPKAAAAAEKTEEGAAEASETQEGTSSAGEGEGSSAMPPASAGITYELCAGLVDKPDLSLEEVARQEVLEECGYDVPASKLKKITSYRSGVGVTGSKQTMFYAEVSDDNCVSAGGGEPKEGELIEVVKIPLHEAMTFAYNERIPKTMGVIFSFMWFHNNMAPRYKISTNV